MGQDTRLVRLLGAFLAAALLTLGAEHEAAAQGASQKLQTKIWDIRIGTPWKELPGEFSEGYMRQACGTNGGPPSLPLEGWGEFGRCPLDPDTGLYEVWFSYDDEAEYMLRAQRARVDALGLWLANALFNHPVFFSLLFNGEGRVQGYRAISDDRENPETRMHADVLYVPLRTVYGFEGWDCEDLAPAEGETPIGGRFVKTVCQKITDGLKVRLRVHSFAKTGQQANLPGLQDRTNQFDVSVRLDAINADLAL